MTENAAIRILEGATSNEELYLYDAEDRPYLIARAENIALNALKEVQQYHEIGMSFEVVEEFKRMDKEQDGAILGIIGVLKELGQYRKLAKTPTPTPPIPVDTQLYIKKLEEKIEETRNKAIDEMQDNLIRNSRTGVIDGEICLIVTDERIKQIAKQMKEGM